MDAEGSDLDGDDPQVLHVFHIPEECIADLITYFRTALAIAEQLGVPPDGIPKESLEMICEMMAGAHEAQDRHRDDGQGVEVVIDLVPPCDHPHHKHVPRDPRLN
jgi:hypothetical protein